MTAGSALIAANAPTSVSRHSRRRSRSVTIKGRAAPAAFRGGEGGRRNASSLIAIGSALLKGNLGAPGSEAKLQDLLVVTKDVGAVMEGRDSAPVSPDIPENLLGRRHGQRSLEQNESRAECDRGCRRV